MNATTPGEETEQLCAGPTPAAADGTASADNLKPLANGELVQYTGQAGLDAASGKRRKVNARVEALELSSDEAERRVATIQYEEKCSATTVNCSARMNSRSRTPMCARKTATAGS